MDINKEVQKATDKIITEKLPQLVEEKVLSMLNSVLQDIFSNYGEMSKLIKTKIEEKIDVNLQEFDLIDYNHLISKTINDNLIQTVNLQPILDITQNAIGFVNKKEITLDEIADMVKEVAMSDYSYQSEYSGEITFELRESDDGGHIKLCADIEPDTDEHDCQIQLCFSINDSRDGKIFLFKTSNWCDRNAKEITPARMVNMDALEAKIFRLYSAQVKITNYNESISTEWYRENY
ncbi:hypothetical protein [Empedobacter falsenii]